MSETFHTADDIVETTMEEDIVTEAEQNNVIEEKVKITLTDERQEEIPISFTPSKEIMNQVISESDYLVNLYMKLKTTKYGTKAANEDLYKASLRYLLRFNILMVPYLDLEDRETIINTIALDAIAVSRGIRDFVISKMNESE
jgi:hypothetical protein